VHEKNEDIVRDDESFFFMDRTGTQVAYLLES